MHLVNNNRRSLLFWAALSLVAILLSESITHVKGYPMMVEVIEDEERCLRLNIPEDDDAHMVFLVLPSSGNAAGQNFDKLEAHFMEQMQEITKRKSETSGLARKFPDKPPSDIQTTMDEFAKPLDLKTPCKITLTNPKSTNSRSMDTYWFTPLVINYVRRAIRTQKKDRESSPLEGYMACFQNEDDENPVHVVVDSVLVSEGPEYDDDTATEDPVFQGHHLTPLAEQLEESIRAAKTIVNEMQYMERREARMRHTADSINARVRYFSYISIGILLVVTYFQVTYLKRYFRKKKLL